MKTVAKLLKSSDADLWYYFFGVRPNIDKSYKSFFREDKKPGCRFYVKGDKLLFNDFSDGEIYDIQKAVEVKYGLSFADAAKKIRNAPRQDIEVTNTFGSKSERTISFTLDSNDFRYFKSFGIKAESVDFFDVRNIKSLYIDDKLHWRATAKNPIFLYPLTNGRKFYRPLHHSKWLSEGTGIFGLDKLPKKGRLVFITSSAKEVMLLHTLGFPAVALPSEGISRNENYPSNVILRKLIAVLKSKFEVVLTLFDNDEAGMKAYHLCRELFSLEGGVTPIKRFKDLTDHSRHYGVHNSYCVIKKIIKKCIQH